MTAPIGPSASPAPAANTARALVALTAGLDPHEVVCNAGSTATWLWAPPVAKACASVAGERQRPTLLSSDSAVRRRRQFSDGGRTRPAFVPAAGEYIMFAGALGPHKGVDVLLEAYAGLDPAVPLVLVGLRRADSPERLP